MLNQRVTPAPIKWILYSICIWTAILMEKGIIASGNFHECGLPGIPANGNIVLKNNAFDNYDVKNNTTKFNVNYYCDDGYTLFGNSNRTCVNMTWIPSIPKCAASDIALRKKVVQFKKNSETNSPGHVVDGNLETCSRAYQDLGKGSWTDIYLPRMYTILAFNITIQKYNAFDIVFFVGKNDPANEIKYVECASTGLHKSSYKQKSVFFKCNNLNGETGEIVRILDKRPTTAMVDICEIQIFGLENNNCGNPDIPKHGRVKFQSEVTVEFICDHGYFISGSRYANCTNGIWENAGPKYPALCKELFCNSPPLVKNANILVEDTDKGRIASYVCDKNFHLGNDGHLKCSENGKWIGDIPVCIENNKTKTCPSPAVPNNGNVNVHSNSVAQFSCKMGYFMVGSQISHCVNGSWDYGSPTCKEFNCSEILIDNANLTVRNTEDGRIASYVCMEKFYLLEGNFELNCSEDGHWIGSMPKCISIAETMPTTSSLIGNYGIWATGSVMLLIIISFLVCLIILLIRVKKIRNDNRKLSLEHNKYESLRRYSKLTDKTDESGNLYKIEDPHYLQPISRSNENVYESVK